MSDEDVTTSCTPRNLRSRGSVCQPAASSARGARGSVCQPSACTSRSPRTLDARGSVCQPSASTARSPRSTDARGSVIRLADCGGSAPPCPPGGMLGLMGTAVSPLPGRPPKIEVEIIDKTRPTSAGQVSLGRCSPPPGSAASGRISPRPGSPPSPDDPQALAPPLRHACMSASGVNARRSLCFTREHTVADLACSFYDELK